MERLKQLIKSTTFWLGVLAVVAGIAQYINGLPAGTSTLQMVTGIIAVIISIVSQKVNQAPSALGASQDGNWLGRLYSWFWFHTEFWLTPINRRPYTFIMRDWIYTHIPQFISLLVIWLGGLITLSVWHGTTSTIISILTSMLLAHLVWGSKWVEHEQEYPTYLD
jgi:hypothetical protein